MYYLKAIVLCLGIILSCYPTADAAKCLSIRAGNWNNFMNWSSSATRTECPRSAQIVPGAVGFTNYSAVIDKSAGTGYSMTVLKDDVFDVPSIRFLTTSSSLVETRIDIYGDLTVRNNPMIPANGSHVKVWGGGVWRLKGVSGQKVGITGVAANDYYYIEASGTGWGSNCTSNLGNRCYATIDGTSTSGVPTDNGTLTGLAERGIVDLRYVYLNNLGSSASNEQAVAYAPKAGVTGQSITIQDAILNGGGTIYVGNLLADTNMLLNRIDIRNSEAHINGIIHLAGYATAKDAGATRTVSNVTYYGTTTRKILSSMNDVTFSNIYLYNGWYDGGLVTLQAFNTIFDNIILMKDQVTTQGFALGLGWNTGISVTNSIFCLNAAQDGNPHYLHSAQGAVIDNNVFDGGPSYSADSGEAVLGGYNTFTQNILIGYVGAGMAGTAATSSSNDVINNTCVGEGTWLIQTGESFAPADFIRLVRNNIMFTRFSDTVEHFPGLWRLSAQSQTQMDLDYNASYNSGSATNLLYPDPYPNNPDMAGVRSYASHELAVPWIVGKTFGVDYATHDQYGDPGFKDRTMTFLKATGNSADLATAAQKVVTLNGWDHSNPPQRVTPGTYTANSILATIRNAFTPTASWALLGDPTQTRTYIGAVNPDTAAGANIWQRIYRSKIFH